MTNKQNSGGGKNYTVTNAGAQQVAPLHKQPSSPPCKVRRGTDLRTGGSSKK